MTDPDAQTISLAVRRLGFAELGDCALLRNVPIETPVQSRYAASVMRS